MGGFNFGGLQQGGANTGRDSRFGGFMRRPQMPTMGPDGQPAIAPNMGQVNRPGIFDRMRPQGGFVPPGQPQQGNERLMAILQMLRARAGSR